MTVYITLQSPLEAKRAYTKTITRQKCGDPPHELALRFAGCNLRCGACFAAAYSWEEKFRGNRRVKADITIEQIFNDFKQTIVPDNYKRFNWLRILGGEPLYNDEYIDYLFDVLMKISKKNSTKFNNGIIIQTNGIHIGMGNTSLLSKRLIELYEINQDIIVAIEVSIKGTNPEEFILITRSDSGLFNYNIKAFENLINLDVPNLRPVIIAGYGISESHLLSEGKNPRSDITLLFNKNTPTYHPSIWSDQFKDLYEDFTERYSKFDPMFQKMPMYGIKDIFQYAWVKYAIKNAKEIYKHKIYDSKYQEKNKEIENKFTDILEKFFLKSNQEYYSTLIRPI